MAKKLSEDEQRAYDALGQLGGSARREEDIVFSGDKIILPENSSLKRAHKFIGERIVQEEEVTDFSRVFPYRPWDGACATWRAFVRLFGMIGHHSSTVQTMFGPMKSAPEMRTVKVGPGVTVQVPWGDFDLPLLPGLTISLGISRNAELGVLFAVSIRGPRKYRDQVEGLFKIIQKELDEASIYRGQAIDGAEEPDFLDLNAVRREQVVFSEETAVQLEANIWSVMRYADELKSAGFALKRSTLLYGEYGTGKSLAGLLTAQVAVAHGWTSILCRPGKDSLQKVMQDARLYQPAVVFFEDVDVISDPTGKTGDQVSELLDLFDGLAAKGTDIMIVLTTNHPDRIHKAMIRPGRLDAVIHVGALDADGIVQLVRVTLPENTLDPTVDNDRVAQAYAGMLPAYVKEGADRSFRFALARSGKLENVLITTEDLEHAAAGLRPQLEMMEGAKEHDAPESLGLGFKRMVKETMFDVLNIEAVDPEKYDEAMETKKA